MNNYQIDLTGVFVVIPFSFQEDFLGENDERVPDLGNMQIVKTPESMELAATDMMQVCDFISIWNAKTKVVYDFYMRPTLEDCRCLYE